MDKYYTLMIVPEREKGVKWIRIPRLTLVAVSAATVVALLLIAMLIHNYLSVMSQISDNRHLTLENKQLREQIQLFQMKINTLTDDMERLEHFERKLRAITGASKLSTDEVSVNSVPEWIEQLKNHPEFENLKDQYEQKIAANLGLLTGHKMTQNLNPLIKKSLDLSTPFALFDQAFVVLRDKVRELESKIHSLDTFLLDRESFVRSTPTLLPTKGWVTSFFGPRQSPYSGRLKMHEGIDIGAETGTIIVAPADGVVTFSGEKPGFGKFVQINHGYGVETIFGHNQSLLVKKGEKVTRATPIAKVGNTGISTGPHLHYEVRVNGVAVDPLYYILDH